MSRTFIISIDGSQKNAEAFLKSLQDNKVVGIRHSKGTGMRVLPVLFIYRTDDRRDDV